MLSWDSVAFLFVLDIISIMFLFFELDLIGSLHVNVNACQCLSVRVCMYVSKYIVVLNTLFSM